MYREGWMPKLPSVTNLLENPLSHEEQFHELVSSGAARLEHIVSHGQASEPGFWYDQESDEWVVLIQGSACLEFTAGEVFLQAGDCLTIPAHMKHRVSSVSQDAVWLALHFLV